MFKKELGLVFHGWNNLPTYESPSPASAPAPRPSASKSPKLLCPLPAPQSAHPGVDEGVAVGGKGPLVLQQADGGGEVGRHGEGAVEAGAGAWKMNAFLLQSLYDTSPS